jgi:hypothetical protein
MSSDAYRRQRTHRTDGFNEKRPFFMCETVKIVPFKIHKGFQALAWLKRRFEQGAGTAKPM